MKTETPPPRLVPDRPSDADRESMKFLAYRLIQMESPLAFCRDTITDAASWLERFADTLPAEAPAERGGIPANADFIEECAQKLADLHYPRMGRALRDIAAEYRALAAAPAGPAPVDMSDDAIGRIADQVYTELRANGYTGAQGGMWWNKAMFAAGVRSASAPRVTGGREELATLQVIHNCLRRDHERSKAQAKAARDVANQWNADARAEGFGGGSVKGREIIDAMDAALQAATGGEG